MTNKLELEPFENAIKSLSEVIQYYKNEQSDIVRDSCIKRFEYTYELSHKMLKRYLEMTVPSPAEIDEYTFQTLIRTGYEKGLLLNSWDKWHSYRDNRNRTSHAYNKNQAKEIVEGLEDFLDEVEYLLEKLKGNGAK